MVGSPIFRISANSVSRAGKFHDERMHVYPTCAGVLVVIGIHANFIMLETVINGA